MIFPIVKKKFMNFGWAEPIRKNRDYNSVARKTFLVDQLPGFHCSRYGYTHQDEKYMHSEEECTVAEVLLI